MNGLKLACIVSTLIGVFITVSYSRFAQAKGWKIGKYFYSEKGSWFMIISFLLLISGGYFSFKTFGWWEGILIIFGSWLFAGILTQILKSHVQILAILLTLTGIVLYFIAYSTIIYPVSK